MKASQIALRSLELDRQRSLRYASKGRSGLSLATDTLEELGPEDLGGDGDDSSEIDIAPWRGEGHMGLHSGWKLVRNTQALLQVSKRFAASPRGIFADLGSSDHQSFVGKVLSSRWLMAKSTRELRALYGPLFGGHSDFDRSKLLGIATQVIHQVKVHTASACWNEQLKPLKDELAALSAKHKSLVDQFHKAREGYLHEIAALRDEVRFRGDPEDGLPALDLVYYMEPNQLLDADEQQFALKVVTEKLKMIFERNPKSTSGYDVGQFERLKETAQSRELEDMRAALKRTMEKLMAAEHTLADEKRKLRHAEMTPVIHHYNGGGGDGEAAAAGFKERLMGALEIQVEELRVTLEEEQREGRLARRRAEELEEDKEALRRQLREERENKVLMQGKLNHASSRLSVYEAKNNTLAEDKRNLDRSLKAGKAEIKDLKAQIRHLSARQMAICPNCGSAVDVDMSPAAREHALRPLKTQPMDEPEPELERSVRFQGASPPQRADGKAPAPPGTSPRAAAWPQKPATGGPRLDTVKPRQLRIRRHPATSSARVAADGDVSDPADAGAGMADAGAGIGITGASTGIARTSSKASSALDDERPVALAAPAELLMTPEAFNGQQLAMREHITEKEEALRRIQDLETQRDRLKMLLHRHVRGLARQETHRLLDDSEDLLAQAEALGCRKDLAKAGRPAPPSPAPGAAGAQAGPAEQREEPGAKEAGASSTAGLAEKLRELQDALDEALGNLHGELKHEGEDSQKKAAEAAPEDDTERAHRMMEAQREVARLKHEKGATEAKLVAAHVMESQAAMDAIEEEDSPDILRGELDATRHMLASTQRLCEGLTSQVARLTEDNAKMSSTIDKVQHTLQKASEAVGDASGGAALPGTEPVGQCLEIIEEAMNHSVFFPMAEGDVTKTSTERAVQIRDLMEETMGALRSTNSSMTPSALRQARDFDSDSFGDSESPGSDDEGPWASGGSPGAMVHTLTSNHEAPDLLGELQVRSPEDLWKALDNGPDVACGSPIARAHNKQGQFAVHCLGDDASTSGAKRSAAPGLGAGSSGSPVGPSGGGPGAGSPGLPSGSAPSGARQSRSGHSAPGEGAGDGGRGRGQLELSPQTRRRLAPSAAPDLGSAGPDASAESRSGSQTSVESGSAAHRSPSSPQDPARQPIVVAEHSPRPGSPEAAAGGAQAAVGAAAAELRGPQAAPAAPAVPGNPHPSTGSAGAGRGGASRSGGRPAAMEGAMLEEQAFSSASAAAYKDIAVQTEWQLGAELDEEDLVRQLHESRKNAAEAEARCEHFRDLLCQHVQGAVLSHSEDLLDDAENLSYEAEALGGARAEPREDAHTPPPRTPVDRHVVPALEAELKETDERLDRAVASLQREFQAGDADAGTYRATGAPSKPDAERMARVVEAQREVTRLRRAKSTVEATLLSVRAAESQSSMAVAGKALQEAERRGACGCSCKGCSCKLKLDAMSKLLAKTLQLCSESTSKFKSTAEENFNISSTLTDVQGMLRKANIAFEESTVVRTASMDHRLMEALEALQQAEHTSVFSRLYHNKTRSRARRDERMNHMVQELFAAIHYRSDWPLRQLQTVEVPFHVRSASPVLQPLHKPKRRSVEDIPHTLAVPERQERMAMVPERHEKSALPTVSVRFDPDQHFLNQTKVGRVTKSLVRDVSPTPLTSCPESGMLDKHKMAPPTRDTSPVIGGLSPFAPRSPGPQTGHPAPTTLPPPGRTGLELGRRRTPTLSPDMDEALPHGGVRAPRSLTAPDAAAGGQRARPSTTPDASPDVPRRRRGSLGSRMDLKW